ncbi:MAG: formate dehydrogenase-N subunit alpha [Selenomonadaceae bacterium]|nr:formate dehydrogenase-N subunit alpha [Selenomonadaceae bacterium]
MDISRRSFLKATGLSGLGLALSSLGLNLPTVKAEIKKEFKLTGAKEFTTTCHFCACGCGQIGYVKEGKLINLEGAVDSPVNRGALCPKGQGYSHIPNSEERAKVPLYRAPGSDHWEEISWDEAIERAAKAIKKARDENWIASEEIDGQQVQVNRTDAFGVIGGSQINNEECYQLVKMFRALGGMYVDNQTRVCHANTPPALNAAFGRGAMTNQWYDLKNTKLVWIEGSNMAECHPIGMKHVMKAKDKGAKIIHVDVRYTRTSKIADYFIQIRPGTDIAFLGAIINYVIQNKKYNEPYLRRHTNAYCLINPNFGFDDGIFSGYNPDKRSYDMTTWMYQVDENGKPMKAAELEAPNTVFSLLKQHYSRYTPEKVSEITGASPSKIQFAAELFANTEPTVFMYALGLTQHTIGVENIRCYTILQLLKGNIGVPGGGIDAMRGQPNVQASTDYGLMFQYFPGYLAWPTQNTNTLEKWTNASGTFRAKFLKNLMKAWYGDAATPENDYAFNFLPIRNTHNNYSIYCQFEAALKGIMKCMFVCGQNPQVSNPNLGMVHRGLCKLDTLIVEDPYVNETAEFWNRPDNPEGSEPRPPSEIKTEVIFMPACSYLERCGTMSNSMRMIQWRMAGPDPVGDSKPDYEILDMLWKKIRELYASSTDPKDNPIKALTWNYRTGPDMVIDLMKEVNGYDLTTGHLLNGIGEIKDDGTTNSGMWIYAGVIRDGEVHMAKRRGQEDEGDMGVFPNYGWVWPDNIHLLYNRASCDENGQPTDPNRKLVWWDAAAGQWTGYDRPDVGSLTAGPDTPAGQKPFRMTGEGIGRLFAAKYSDVENGQTRDASSTPVDGPMPEFYEPVESPTKNALHENPNAQFSPCVIYPRMPDLQKIGTKDEFPYVMSSSSLTEHWCSGTITRHIPWLNELVKEPFIEMPHKLADKLGVKSGDKVKVRSTRAEITVKAMVTNRIQPLRINGEETFVTWMPYNWGFKGLSTGPSGNYITIDALDPNAQSQEFKACLIDIKKA